MKGDELARLTGARLILRNKVLAAVMAQDVSEQVTAWSDVDSAAADLVRRRRAYDKGIRELADCVAAVTDYARQRELEQQGAAR